MTEQHEFATWDALSAPEIAERALKELPGPACFTCSFQAEDMAVLHVLRQVEPNIPVLFLETGYHFPETIAYRDRFAEKWKLNLQKRDAGITVDDQESQVGILNKTDPTR